MTSTPYSLDDPQSANSQRNSKCQKLYNKKREIKPKWNMTCPTNCVRVLLGGHINNKSNDVNYNKIVKISRPYQNPDVPVVGASLQFKKIVTTALSHAEVVVSGCNLCSID